ncbi:MAG: hypothetical protein RLZ98_2576 [Pseudomonadota bacterium]
MTTNSAFEIFLVATPGLEVVLCEEAQALGFEGAAVIKGGVTLRGGWPEVWRANLELRGATRVVARIGAFRAFHLAQLDKRARRFAWGDVLRPDVPIRVEVSCRGSRIYHSGAAAERIGRAIHDELGCPISEEADVRVMARIESDLCTLGIDTSGEPLHKRGHKEAVNRAPMRETLAAMFLRQCGYTGNEPVVDPMCGSGTFVIEAAEMALGLAPGRSRRFAFEQLATFDEAGWRAMSAARRNPDAQSSFRFFGSDRDAGAIAMSVANAERAGVAAITDFRQHAVSGLIAPAGPAGLVITNPPYGDRVGDKKRLAALYAALGQTLTAGFSGWRVGIVTSDGALARATRLPFGQPAAPVTHGGIRVRLFTTGRLA